MYPIEPTHGLLPALAATPSNIPTATMAMNGADPSNGCSAPPPQVVSFHRRWW